MYCLYLNWTMNANSFIKTIVNQSSMFLAATLLGWMDRSLSETSRNVACIINMFSVFTHKVESKHGT